MLLALAARERAWSGEDHQRAAAKSSLEFPTPFLLLTGKSQGVSWEDKPLACRPKQPSRKIKWFTPAIMPRGIGTHSGVSVRSRGEC